MEAADEHAKAVKYGAVVQAVSAHLEALVERQHPPAVQQIAGEEWGEAKRVDVDSERKSVFQH